MGDDLTHFGAFNHSNIGDRLYGVLLPLLTGREFRRAALQRQETPDFSVEAIDDCRGPVIVGGGACHQGAEQGARGAGRVHAPG